MKPNAPVERSDQTDVPATFFNPTTPYQYSNGEMHFPVFHGHQLESNQWAVGHKAQQSGVAPRPSASAAMRQDAPRFQRVIEEKSEHIYPLRGRFHLRDAADSSNSVHRISKAVRSAFHLAPGVPVDKAPRFVETASEVHNVQASSQLHNATADGMRFQQIQTHMGMGSGDIEDPNAGPRYNWAPGAPDPNKMQWYQSPTIMYPQNPSLRPLGNMDPASGITGSAAPLQTAPTPPAMYPQHTDPEAFPNEIATTAPAEVVNAPLPPPSPPKFTEVKAVTGYASPRSATTQSIWLQQPPTQSTVQAIQQQPMLSPTMQQQYQPASTAQPAVAAQYIAPAVQQSVQYVMTTQPQAQTQQPQAQMQQQVQPPVLTQQGQRQPSINSQQPVVINLVLPNGAPQASGVNNAAASAQSTRLNTTPEQAKVVRPSDGLPTTHMQIAELSTVQVSDRHDIPQPPAMRDAPQAK